MTPLRLAAKRPSLAIRVCFGTVLVLTNWLFGGALARAEDSQATQTEPTTGTTDVSPPVQAASPKNSRVDLPEDQIRGEDELPKVLYIVPWRSLHETPSLDASPDLSANDLFAPLDPDAHGRLIDYRRALAEPAENE